MRRRFGDLSRALALVLSAVLCSVAVAPSTAAPAPPDTLGAALSADGFDVASGDVLNVFGPDGRYAPAIFGPRPRPVPDPEPVAVSPAARVAAASPPDTPPGHGAPPGDPHPPAGPPGPAALDVPDLDDLTRRLGTAAPFFGDDDIPPLMLRAYRGAAARSGAVAPGCGVPWSVLAGLGRVESNHGAHWGKATAFAPNGDVRPPIVGPTLDGAGGVAAIRDTDRGRWDGDTTWDHAVGPMQFIPSSWQLFGRDGNGDGVVDPHNAYDATLAAVAHLCSRPADLGDRAALARAVYGYNHSTDYVASVLSWIGVYDGAGGAVPGLPAPAPRVASAVPPLPSPAPEPGVATPEPVSPPERVTPPEPVTPASPEPRSQSRSPRRPGSPVRDHAPRPDSSAPAPRPGRPAGPAPVADPRPSPPPPDQPGPEDPRDDHRPDSDATTPTDGPQAGSPRRIPHAEARDQLATTDEPPDGLAATDVPPDDACGDALEALRRAADTDDGIARLLTPAVRWSTPHGFPRPRPSLDDDEELAQHLRLAGDTGLRLWLKPSPGAEDRVDYALVDDGGEELEHGLVLLDCETGLVDVWRTEETSPADDLTRERPPADDTKPADDTDHEPTVEPDDHTKPADDTNHEPTVEPDDDDPAEDTDPSEDIEDSDKAERPGEAASAAAEHPRPDPPAPGDGS